MTGRDGRRPVARNEVVVLTILDGYGVGSGEPPTTEALARLCNRSPDPMRRTLNNLRAAGWCWRIVARQAPARWRITPAGHDLVATLPPLARRTEGDWHRTALPATIDDLTADMLVPLQKVADVSRLPQTVWPSKWFGPAAYFGREHLVTSSAAILNPPADAAEGGQVRPFLTLLPASWWDGREPG